MIAPVLFTALLGTVSALGGVRNEPKTLAPFARAVSSIADLVSALEDDGDIVINNDLDFSGHDSEFSLSVFSGTINGNFHTFKNLNVPLLASNSGTVENIILKNDTSSSAIDITESIYGSIAKVNTGTIRCVGVEKDFEFNCASTETDYCIGAICGVNEGTIEYSYILDNTVSFNGFNANLVCGGISGSNTGTMEYLYSTANYSFLNNKVVSFGKICGQAADESINQSFSKGSLDVRTDSSEMSSVGYICPSITALKDCYAYTGSNLLQNTSLVDYKDIKSLNSEDKIADFINYEPTVFYEYGVQNTETTAYEYKFNYYKAFNVENGASYDRGVDISLNGGEATLNGEPFDGNSVTRSGFYDLVISLDSGRYIKKIHFSVNAIIYNIEDGGIYNVRNNPSATFNSCDAELDGELYTAGTPIKVIGNHVMTFTGENGYSFSYSFTVEPGIVGLSDGDTYDMCANYRIYGVDHFLDGVKKEEDKQVLVTEPGNHTVVIYGLNGYVKTINFAVELIVAAGREVINPGNYEYTGSVSFDISGGAASIDGINYITNNKYSRVGNHTLIVKGKDDYLKSFNFVVHPAITGIEETESNAVYYSCSGGQSYLDGKPIPNDYLVKTPGEHTVYVTGDNGYVSETKTFTVSLTKRLMSLGDGSYFFEFSGGDCYLDGKKFGGGVISRIGKHVIIVRGLNDEIFYQSPQFSITTNINLIPQGEKAYTEPPIIPALDADVYLDGKLIAYNKEKRIEDEGTHTIHVVGVNYEKVFTVTYKNPSYSYTIIYSCVTIPVIALIVVVIVIRARKKA